MKRVLRLNAIAAAIAALTVCGGCELFNMNTDGPCDPAASNCTEGSTCQELLSGEFRCGAPLMIKGQVLDITNDAPIADARVQAVDVNGAAVGTTGVTDGNGAYSLTVPALRDETGAPVTGSFTLRVQAMGCQAFPSAIRPALPVDATSAVSQDGAWVIENVLTTVKLIPLAGDTSTLGSIAGTVQGDQRAGVLVVAEGAASASTGFSDSEGAYLIFNVPAGSLTVRGFAAGAQLDPAAVTLEAGENKTGVDLLASDRPLNTVSGTVQIVNAAGGGLTSVILAVESTFVEAAGRGSVPPGLRVGDVGGAFVIENVPDGRYVVLAAFENDGLVRDPDQSISGTQTVHIELPDPAAGNVLQISEGFKVTGALETMTPGANQPEEVTTPTPVLEWADDS
ncbi:MAG: carboxypeptidase-like regulatory domain-containing protein, partial [Phycisphaerae bacterium]